MGKGTQNSPVAVSMSPSWLEAQRLRCGACREKGARGRGGVGQVEGQGWLVAGRAGVTLVGRDECRLTLARRVVAASHSRWS